jgi:glycosyltransferase involved in cell wall biosynthesis
VLSVLIPASNEAGYIGPCLGALFASAGVSGQAIVIANGCRDATADMARAEIPRAAALGWELVVIERAEGSKTGALNAGDAVARHGIRIYLDADVIVSPGLVAALLRSLGTDAPRYASGTPNIPRARSVFTRAYARFWQRLPFNQTPAPGYGLFAVNASGRARWGAFPMLISDDTFVRLCFAPPERVQVADSYDWPMIEGFGALTRVRMRQDAGVRELAAQHPGLMGNEGKPSLSVAGLTALVLRDPLAFAAYAAVSLAVRLRPAGPGFTRGR